MAVVNVELSEYDALRESLKDYKERVAKLDNEISGLKKGENVVVTTKYCVRKLKNIEDLIRNSVERLKQIYANNCYSTFGVREYNTYRDISNDPTLLNCLAQIISSAFSHGGLHCGIGDYEVKESSTEVQGYNDLRLVIENKLKEEAKAEIDSLIEEYNDSVYNYNKKHSELENVFEEKFKKESDKLEKEYKDKFEQFESTIENREKTIVDLQTELSDKSDRLGKAEKEISDNVQYKNGYFELKEQNELLNEKIETLTKELEKAKKPSLLNKVFNW